jgi:hypothetical protein
LFKMKTDYKKKQQLSRKYILKLVLQAWKYAIRNSLIDVQFQKRVKHTWSITQHGEKLVWEENQKASMKTTTKSHAKAQLFY